MKKSLIKKNKGVIKIIIITYNNESTVENCLISVFKNKIPNFQKEIIIIDNNSQDGTSRILAGFKKDKRISRIILNNFNAGFGKTINKILEDEREKNSTDFFFLLNPDATIEFNALENLIKKANNDKGVGLLSCKIIDPKTKECLFERGSVDFLRFKTTHTTPGMFQTEYVTGCALLIRNSLIEKIGLFDSNFFLYYEDADFSKRALDAGFKIDTENSAICYHQESHSSTSAIKDYFLTRNALYFFHKHYQKTALPYFWTAFFLRFIYHKIFSKKEVIIKAMRDFWYN